jgi:hypothetical protein
VDPNRWKLGETEFVYGYERKSDADRFFIAKSAELIQLYVDLSPAFVGGTIVDSALQQAAVLRFLACSLNRRS